MATLGMNVKWRALPRLFKEKHDDAAFFEDEPRCVKFSLSLPLTLSHSHSQSLLRQSASEQQQRRHDQLASSTIDDENDENDHLGSNLFFSDRNFLNSIGSQKLSDNSDLVWTRWC